MKVTVERAFVAPKSLDSYTKYIYIVLEKFANWIIYASAAAADGLILNLSFGKINNKSDKTYLLLISKQFLLNIFYKFKLRLLS